MATAASLKRRTAPSTNGQRIETEEDRPTSFYMPAAAGSSLAAFREWTYSDDFPHIR